MENHTELQRRRAPSVQRDTTRHQLSLTETCRPPSADCGRDTSALSNAPSPAFYNPSRRLRKPENPAQVTASFNNCSSKRRAMAKSYEPVIDTDANRWSTPSTIDSGSLSPSRVSTTRCKCSQNKGSADIGRQNKTDDFLRVVSGSVDANLSPQPCGTSMILGKSPIIDDCVSS